jgi:hypothetical protein
MTRLLRFSLVVVSALLLSPLLIVLFVVLIMQPHEPIDWEKDPGDLFHP